MPDRTRLLELAMKGLQAERAKIDAEIAQIRSELNQRPPTAATTESGSTALAPLRKRRKMSAAARRKISEAMKHRYAAKKVISQSNAPSQVRKAGPKQIAPKKQNVGDRLTAAGRKKLSDLMKKRWADRRKAR